MTRISLYLFLFLFLTVIAKADDLATRTFLADKPDDQAALHGVYRACLNLTRTGTEEAVPLLSQLLDDERFSTVARTALINLPGDAGIKALRESLSTLQGKNLIGVIQTLGNARDKESVDAIVKIVETAEDKELAEAGMRALGNIDPEKTWNFIINQLTKDRHRYNPAINEALLNTADRSREERIRQQEKYKDMEEYMAMIGFYYAVVMRDSDDESSRNAATLVFLLWAEGDEVIAGGGEKIIGTPVSLGTLLQNSLRYGRNQTSFNVILRAVLELKSEDTGTIVLDNMGNLPVWQQAALVRNLGARKDSIAIVPRLIELLTQSEEQELRLAAASALGEIGDPKAVDALLLAVGAEDAELSKAAQENLKLFSGEEFDRKIIALLDSNDKKLVLVALEVIGARQMVAASEKLKTLIPDRDRDIRQSVYTAYANAVAPTKENIEFLLRRLLASRQQFVRLPSEQMEPIEAELKTLREAILTLCRRTDDRDNVVDLFTGIRRPDLGVFFLDCLFQLGGEKAADAIANIAKGDNETLHDKATELLGRWTTPEVAPYLIDIAENHPNERYRSRTLRGYLRVIRQMGLPVEQKVQMAEKALSVASVVNLTDADKEQAREVLEQVKEMFNETRQ